MKHILLFVALLCATTTGYAQSILNKPVSVNVNHKPVSYVLDNISAQGNFHFSYVRDFVRDDSLVTIRVEKRTVRQVLDILFQGNCHYKEIGDQVIIQQGSSPKEKWFVVSGRVTDALTGHPVSNASVYEGTQLMSTFTNDQGFYRLKLRERERPVPINVMVSKDLYRDTALIISGGYDQEINARVRPAAPIQLSVVDVNQYTHVEQTWVGRFFLSSRQRMQSLNIRDFFSNQPYQYSILPAIGTHGKLSSQVINKISFNMLGGYAAGLNGFEVAGLFNIDQKDVQYVQIAGIFNVVGGSFKGAQITGVHNQVMDSLKGAQIGGVSNNTEDGFRGIQIAGVYNRSGATSYGAQIAGVLNDGKGDLEGVQISGVGSITRGGMDGIQIAGVFSYRKKGGKGLQISGVGNVTGDTVSGAQIAGVFNYTRQLKKGVQIGLVNIADSSNGYSLGLINIVRKGYHQLLVYNTEFTDINVAYRSGNRKLYSLLLAGMSLNGKEKAYTFGYGVGTTFHRSDLDNITLELTNESVYLGDWEVTNSMFRFQSAWNRRLTKSITVFAGPSFSLFYDDRKKVSVPGYKGLLPGRYGAFSANTSFNCWFGWHLGFAFF